MFDPKQPTLKKRLAEGPPLGVCWFTLGSVSIVEAAVGAGADAIVIDMQHGLFDRITLEAAIGVVPAHIPCIVRVEDDSATAIGRALDAGAEGVIIPLIETAVQARQAVASCHYPPKGLRSNGGIRPLRRKGYMTAAADAIAVGLMIETTTGVSNAAAIAATKDADFVFIGIGDLALSLGTTIGSATHSGACKTIFDASRQAGIPCGMFTMDSQAAASRVAEGYCMSVVANDASAVSNAFAADLETFKARRLTS